MGKQRNIKKKKKVTNIDDIDRYWEHVDRYYDFGIWAPGRTLFIGSFEDDYDNSLIGAGTNYLMAEYAVKGLDVLENCSEEARKGKDPIFIKMNNPGGDVGNGYAIYDRIKRCKNHVTIEVCGYAESMGAIILQAADWRIMNKNSSFMFHRGTDGGNTHVENLKRWVKEAERLMEVEDKIFLDRIREKVPFFSRKKLHELLRFDTYMSPERAVEHGLADEVI